MSTVSQPLASTRSDSTLVRGLLTAGLLATAFAATPELTVAPEVVKGAFGGIMVLAALASWLWPGLSRRTVMWHPLLFVPLALSAYALLSTLWSPSETALVESGRWALVSAILLLVLNVSGRSYFETILQSTHWSCVGLSALALAQFWIGLEWFPASAEPGGTFGNRNFFAELVAACLPFSLWLFFRRQTLVSGLRTGLGIAIIVVALMSTGARAALLASIVSIVVMSVLIAVSRHKRSALNSARVQSASAGLMLIVVVGLGSIPSTNEHILREAVGRTAIERTSQRLGSLARSETYEAESSFGVRRAGWIAAQQMMLRYPIQGIGAGAWNSVSPLYMPPELDMQLIWMAHNEPLQLAVEYGLIGWIALGAVGALLAIVSLHCFAQLRNDSRLLVLRSLRTMVLVVSLVTMGIVSLSGFPLHTAATCYLMAVCLGMLLSWSAKTKKYTVPRVMPAFRMTGIVVAVCLVAIGFVVSVQAIRSDYYVRQGTGVLLALAEAPAARNQQKYSTVRDKAIADIEKGLAIYSEHTLSMMSVVGSLMLLGEHELALVYTDKVLGQLPNMISFKCQRVQTLANLRKFDDAEEGVRSIVAMRPEAACLPLTKFIIAFKTENFQEATALGKTHIAALSSKTKKDEARYWVDYTYRAAIRVSDWEAALNALALRARLWPELASGTWLLAARLQAGLAKDSVSPEALESFRKALSAANRAEREKILRDLPAAYRQSL